MPRPQHPAAQPQSPYGQPYGQPPFDQPPYGQQQPPYGQQQPPTNGFAVASLVLGLVAPLGAFVLSVIFGLVAFRQIKRYGQRGIGLAIGGLVATGAWLLVTGVGATVVTQRDTDPISAPTTPPVETTVPAETTAPAPSDSPAETVEADLVGANSLVPGDCIQDLANDGGTVERLPVVPCEAEHEAEVYATFDVPDGDWPGEDVVTEQSQDGCAERLASFPEADDDPETTAFYLFPTEASWADGDRKVICMAFYRDGPRTGSIVD